MSRQASRPPPGAGEVIPLAQVQALRRVALAVAHPGGPGLFADLVRELAASLGVGIVFVAVFTDESRHVMRTLAACVQGRMLRNFDYPLAGSPCAAVVGRSCQYIASGVLPQLAAGSIFAARGVDSFAAFPLNDSAGEPLGQLVAMDRLPIAGGDAAHAEAMLKIIAGRLAAEIERERTEKTLREVALAVSASRSGTVFDELVRLLATILHVEVAFIARYDPTDAQSLRMLAMYHDGQVLRDISYRLKGTPCETVLGQRFRAYPTDLQRLFPDDEDARVQCTQSYAGHPLVALDGSPLGIVSVASRRPLTQLDRVEAMLKIFAVRAAAEVERLRAGETLRDSEEQYRAIFNASADALVLRAADFGIVDVNATYEAMSGFTRAEVLGVDRVLANPPEVMAKIRALHEKALAGEAVRLETQLVRRDGRRYDLELRGVPIQHRGQPHVLYIGRDISHARQAESALRDSEEQYRTIFNASADALVLRDADYRAVEVNPAYTTMSGYTREEVMAADRVLTQSDEALRAHHRAQHALALAGRELRFEVNSTRKDGSTLQAEVRGTPVMYRGRPHVLYATRDTTERTAAERRRAELERQLRQAQKMEAIGQLTGGIAHDFNNILTSVLGYIGMAQERALPLEDAVLARQLDQARLAAERARDHVAQLLAFSRPQRGERRLLDVAPVARQALQLLRPNLPSSIVVDGVAANAEGAASVPPVVADPVQLEQVLFNLCINARDAIRDHGTLRVRVGHSTAAGHCASCSARLEDTQWVWVEVADDGRGMPQDVIERMFEPFFTTKEVGRGTGMGLAMVHGIVHDHGGHIKVVSAPGTGSSFRVLLPGAAQDARAATEAAAVGPAVTRAAPPLKGRVLLAEDEAIVSDYMVNLMGGWGLDVVLEQDPLAAAQRLASADEHFDLLLTDQTMPGMTGLALSRHAARYRPALPVVLYTGNASQVDQEELADCGVDVLLRKPIDGAALRALLGELIG